MIYVVDTNFFIQAHRVYYPLDIFNSFWNEITRLAANGTIISIDKVQNEIYRNEDELKLWCESNLPNDFFKSSENLISDYTQLVQWVNSGSIQYRDTAKSEFLDVNEADAWLIAYCMKHGNTLITYEKSDPNIKKKVKIPEPANHFKVKYHDTIELLRQSGSTI